MWILYALGSAFFAGVTSILAKRGIQKTDSSVATAVRTIIVLLFSWIMVFWVGSQGEISQIDGKSLIFLLLSGIATGASWLCYFKALQTGNINNVVPIDKSSALLTVILSVLFLGESLSWIKGIGVIIAGIGTYFMIERKAPSPSSVSSKRKRSWLFYAVCSAVFASLTAILGKVGITHVESNLGTAIRTIVVLLMAWVVVFVSGKQNTVRKIPKGELFFICLSGIATGASWLCYYKALQQGPAGVVVSIDKLSILVTIGFSFWVFKERLSKKSAVGLSMLVAGTLLMLVEF